MDAGMENDEAPTPPDRPEPGADAIGVDERVRSRPRDEPPDPDRADAGRPIPEPVDLAGEDAHDPVPVATETDGDGEVALPAWAARLVRRALAVPTESWIAFAVVGGAVFFVFQTMWAGGALLDDSIVTGGDMGAHFWGPAFLRDSLIPSGSLSGWAPNWFGGFPAFQFYMVVPALAIVLLNIGGFSGIAAVSLLVFLAMAIRISRRDDRLARLRRIIVPLSIVVVVVGIGLPYGVAFKLVVISGLVSMPLSAWAMGRWSGMSFPGPPLLALATLYFVFDRSFHILGGNGASTMAGEFAFSISLSLALLAIGLYVRGLDTGQGQGWAAIALALTALCHIIPFFFAAGVIALAGLVRLGRSQLTWAVVTTATAGLLTAFWSMPFLARRTFMNDMGWEQTHDWHAALVTRDRLIADFLRDAPPLEVVLPLACVGFGLSLARRNRLGILLGLAVPSLAIAFVYLGGAETRLWNARITPFYYLSLYLLVAIALSESVRLFARRVDGAAEPHGWPLWRLGLLLGATAVAAGLYTAPLMGFAGFYDGQRAGLFQLVLLATWLVGAVAVAEWARVVRLLVLARHERVRAAGHDRLVLRWTPVAAFVVTWLIVGLPLGSVPLSDIGPGRVEHPVGLSADRSFIPGWANYNFRGADGDDKLRYPEYRDILLTMSDVGAEHGCGRALWEYSDTQGEYGTPMAMMLLPHFSDECIGSMEGLYFESSASTPHHFQMQAALSERPSRPQRDLPYPDGLDVALGVDMMQLYGVRYYLTYSPAAYASARANAELTELAVSGPWAVFEVADADLVVPLEHQPVVVEGLGDGQESWLGELDDGGFEQEYPGTASEFFLDPDNWAVFRAGDGPDEWARVARGETPRRVPTEPTLVTDLDVDRDRISFHVDRVGSPILVKTSYFPNWRVSGARGPYRVQPNLMVVIPTAEEVTLRYGRTGVDVAGIVLTALGIGVVIGLFRTRPRRWSDPWFDPVEGVWFGRRDLPDASDVGARAGSDAPEGQGASP